MKDVDFERNELTVRSGKGAKDRVSVLPTSSRESLLEHLERIRKLHTEDLGRGLGRARSPSVSPRNTGTRTGSGVGSTSSQPLRFTSTGTRASSIDTISTKR